MRLKKLTLQSSIVLSGILAIGASAKSAKPIIAAQAKQGAATGAQRTGQPASNAQHFAPDKMETILYGVAFYPEYMPSERLDTDVELMRNAGINVVRVGESTWSSWEPQDGDFQFAWMQRILDRLHQAGIRVILGTPTYSIPTWLYKEHPEIAVTHATTAAPHLSNPYYPTYPGS